MSTNHSRATLVSLVGLSCKATILCSAHPRKTAGIRKLNTAAVSQELAEIQETNLL